MSSFWASTGSEVESTDFDVESTTSDVDSTGSDLESIGSDAASDLADCSMNTSKDDSSMASESMASSRSSDATLANARNDFIPMSFMRPEQWLQRAYKKFRIEKGRAWEFRFDDEMNEHAQRQITRKFFRWREALIRFHRLCCREDRRHELAALIEGASNRDEYEKRLKALDRSVKKSNEELQVLDRNKRRLLDIVREDAAESSARLDTMYYDAVHLLLSNTYRLPTGERLFRGEGRQYRRERERWTQRSLRYYDAADEDRLDEDDMPCWKWCAVAGDFTCQRHVTAPIVPKAFPAKDVACILGDADEEGESIKWDVRNSIPLTMAIADDYAAGEVTIIPDVDDKDGSLLSNDLKLVVLNQRLIDQDYLILPKDRYRDLNGRRLQWRNSNRPSLRYLYLHAVWATLSRRYISLTGEQRGYQHIPTVGISTTTGKWLRRSMVQLLALEAGDLQGQLSNLAESGLFDDTNSADTLGNEQNRAAGMVEAWRWYTARKEPRRGNYDSDVENYSDGDNYIHSRSGYCSSDEENEDSSDA